MEYYKKELLYPYQRKGVWFIEKMDGRALVADEPGLGKTIQALSWLNYHPEKRPVLIICPSSVKTNWYREIKKWMIKSNPEILNGTKPYKTKGDILIINYDILQNWSLHLRKMDFQVLIADEAHYIKNSKAIRTKTFKLISRFIPHVIGLSGTPIENRPSELYNIINTINPLLFPNYYSYLYRYCGAKRNRWGGIDATGASNKKELHELLKKHVMIRRKKKNVLKDLPPKQIIHIPLEIENRKEYITAEINFKSYLHYRYETVDDDLKKELKDFAKRKNIKVSEELSTTEIKKLKIEKINTANILSQIEYLKQLAVEGKFNGIVEWIETFLESDEKLVVFAHHKKIVRELIKKFPDSVAIYGDITQKNRQLAIDKFQKDKKTKLLIANMQSAGMGITLTSASNVAIIQFPWNPSLMNQAIDRVHRITQMKQVTAWLLFAENTIEEKLLSVLKEKEKIISQIIDGKEYDDISVFMELVESYQQIKN